MYTLYPGADRPASPLPPDYRESTMNHLNFPVP